MAFHKRFSIEVGREGTLLWTLVPLLPNGVPVPMISQQAWQFHRKREFISCDFFWKEIIPRSMERFIIIKK